MDAMNKADLDTIIAEICPATQKPHKYQHKYTWTRNGIRYPVMVCRKCRAKYEGEPEGNDENPA